MSTNTDCSHLRSFSRWSHRAVLSTVVSAAAVRVSRASPCSCTSARSGSAARMPSRLRRTRFSSASESRMGPAAARQARLAPPRRARLRRDGGAQRSDECLLLLAHARDLPLLRGEQLRLHGCPQRACLPAARALPPSLAAARSETRPTPRGPPRGVGTPSDATMSALAASAAPSAAEHLALDALVGRRLRRSRASSASPQPPARASRL